MTDLGLTDKTLFTQSCLVAGEWIPAVASQGIAVTNPAGIEEYLEIKFICVAGL